MNAAEMKAKLAEIRFEHENGTHDFDEDSDHVQRVACTSCFLIDTIDTMVARRWDPTTGGPALGDYRPDEEGRGEIVSEDGLDAWITELRGVEAPLPLKDRILALMTASDVRGSVGLGKTLLVSFAGEIEERMKRAALQGEAQVDRDFISSVREDVARILESGEVPDHVWINRDHARDKLGSEWNATGLKINTAVGMLPVVVTDGPCLPGTPYWGVEPRKASAPPSAPPDHEIDLVRVIGQAIIDEIRRQG